MHVKYYLELSLLAHYFYVHAYFLKHTFMRILHYISITKTKKNSTFFDRNIPKKNLTYIFLAIRLPFCATF